MHNWASNVLHVQASIQNLKARGPLKRHRNYSESKISHASPPTRIHSYLIPVLSRESPGERKSIHAGNANKRHSDHDGNGGDAQQIHGTYLVLDRTRSVWGELFHGFCRRNVIHEARHILRIHSKSVFSAFDMIISNLRHGIWYLHWIFVRRSIAYLATVSSPRIEHGRLGRSYEFRRVGVRRSFPLLVCTSILDSNASDHCFQSFPYSSLFYFPIPELFGLNKGGYLIAIPSSRCVSYMFMLHLCAVAQINK